ncbi:sulfite exporter TauE/SafE family protein [Arcanobacterium hippocoleae]
MVVPMLLLALRMPMREASATSLLIMVITSATGLLSRIGSDLAVDWGIVLIFAAASMLGGLLGGPVSRKAKNSTLTFIFAVLLIFVAVFLYLA